MEKVELELFKSGQFEAKDEVVEDPNAPADAPPAEAPAAPPGEGGEGGPPGEGGDAAVATVYSGSTMAVHPWLSSMINYAQPIHFAGFDTAESNYIVF